MELSDWLEHWAKLVEGPEPESPTYHQRHLARKDWWAGGRARRFSELVKDRQELPAVMEEIVRHAGHDATIVDIGAGTGAYAIPFARQVKHVTAIDPSPAMLGFLQERAREEGLTNITLVERKWEDAEIEPHDVTFCSHAMYASKALDQFALKMDQLSRRACFMLARVGNINEGLRQAWTALRGGERLPDPDYLPIYNILYQIGIYADVRILPTRLSWPFATVDDAVEFCLDYLRMDDTPENHSLVRAYLAPELQKTDDHVQLTATASKVALISWSKNA